MSFCHVHRTQTDHYGIKVQHLPQVHFQNFNINYILRLERGPGDGLQVKPYTYFTWIRFPWQSFKQHCCFSITKRTIHDTDMTSHPSEVSHTTKYITRLAIKQELQSITTNNILLTICYITYSVHQYNIQQISSVCVYNPSWILFPRSRCIQDKHLIFTIHFFRNEGGMYVFHSLYHVYNDVLYIKLHTYSILLAFVMITCIPYPNQHHVAFLLLPHQFCESRIHASPVL